MNLTLYQKTPAPCSLTPEELEAALDMSLTLESYIKSLRAEALKRLQDAKDVPGWHLAPTEKQTKILDPIAAQLALRPLMMDSEFWQCCRPSIEKLTQVIRDREGCTIAEAKEMLGEYLKGNLVKPPAGEDDYKLERKPKQVELIELSPTNTKERK